jgi:enamine deaminase RidA (YjgF/YER057c/UK114 family)
MNPTTIDVPGLPPANTTYSQVSKLGDLVFVSGQKGNRPLAKPMSLDRL